MISLDKCLRATPSHDPRVRANGLAGSQGRRVLVCSSTSSEDTTKAAPDTEQAALQAYTTALRPAGTADCLKTLREAANNKSVAPELVEGALVYLEQNQKQDPPTPSPSGTWRLVFGTATKFRAFQYIPVTEDFVIDIPGGKLALESAIGPFEFHVKGPVNSWDASTGVLGFQFTQVDILLLGNKIWEVNPTTKPKTYTWFYQDGSLAAARSSSGGVALMRK